MFLQHLIQVFLNKAIYLLDNVFFNFVKHENYLKLETNNSSLTLQKFKKNSKFYKV